jgi:hypothetical protein
MEFGISFGCMSDPIATQLKEFGYKFDRKEVMRFEEMKDAIHTLAFGGIIPDSTINNCFQKLYNKVEAHICKKNNLKKLNSGTKRVKANSRG